MSTGAMKTIQTIYLIVITFILVGCSQWKEASASIEKHPEIFPDYIGVTVPDNIAPLNFMIEGAEHVQAEFISDGKVVLASTGKKGAIDIPVNEWQSMLKESAGVALQVKVSAWNKEYPEGVVYQPFEINIAEEDIDGWIAYRLIEPGYIEYRQLGIYQRNLSTFEEKAIITNRKSESTCVNCHNFPSYSPESMMFHARGKNGGTILYKQGELKKIDFKSTDFGRNTTYPAWHPDGRYIAFSSNTTHQVFFAQNRQEIEVFDTASDLVIYDTQTGKTITDPRFNTEDILETFPCWSPDGKSMYFVSHKAPVLPVKFSTNMHYDLLRVSFDAETATFGTQIDTLYNSREQGGSASYPRISSDGRYLLYTLSDYGTFPIWHHEADLHMIDLTCNEPVDISVWNDPDNADSYHSWSSNGRWVVFGSRRNDGRYTHLYIGYLDKDGQAHKPFLLPQQDPRQYIWRLKSFNVPEFIAGEVELPEEATDLF